MTKIQNSKYLSPLTSPSRGGGGKKERINLPPPKEGKEKEVEKKRRERGSREEGEEKGKEKKGKRKEGDGKINN